MPRRCVGSVTLTQLPAARAVIAPIMKVAVTLTSALAVALLASPLAVSQAAAAPSASPAKKTTVRSRALTPASLPYDARLLSCVRSPRTDARTAVVGTSMMPVPGSKRLALRIDLFQRPLSGGRWLQRGDVPGLGIWTSPSDPSIGSRPNDVYKFRQAVGRLVVPFAYRFRVSFRWSDAAGKTVREATVTTATCREPDLRPDLVVTGVSVVPDADAGRAVYTVTVRNVGRSPSTAVGVGATFPATTRYVRGLAPLESADVVFVGPACIAGAPGPTFLVDLAKTIDEARETNNSRLVTCPATLDEP